MQNDKLQLTPGSKYRIASLESRDKTLITTGIFKGYIMIGEIDALCMEMDETHKELSGKIRIVPAHMILSIDVITVAKQKREKEEEVAKYVR